MASGQKFDMKMLKRVQQAVAETGEVITLEESIELIEKLNQNDIVLIDVDKRKAVLDPDTKETIWVQGPTGASV